MFDLLTVAVQRPVAWVKQDSQGICNLVPLLSLGSGDPPTPPTRAGAPRGGSGGGGGSKHPWGRFRCCSALPLAMTAFH